MSQQSTIKFKKFPSTDIQKTNTLYNTNTTKNIKKDDYFNSILRGVSRDEKDKALNSVKSLPKDIARKIGINALKQNINLRPFNQIKKSIKLNTLQNIYKREWGFRNNGKNSKEIKDINDRDFNPKNDIGYQEISYGDSHGKNAYHYFSKNAEVLYYPTEDYSNNYYYRQVFNDQTFIELILNSYENKFLINDLQINFSKNKSIQLSQYDEDSTSCRLPLKKGDSAEKIYSDFLGSQWKNNFQIAYFCFMKFIKTAPHPDPSSEIPSLSDQLFDYKYNDEVNLPVEFNINRKINFLDRVRDKIDLEKIQNRLDFNKSFKTPGSCTRTIEMNQDIYKHLVIYVMFFTSFLFDYKSQKTETDIEVSAEKDKIDILFTDVANRYGVKNE